MTKQLTTLPRPEHLETRAVLKQLVTAHRYLAELKGVAATIPNPEILINALSLQTRRPWGMQPQCAKENAHTQTSAWAFLILFSGPSPELRVVGAGGNIATRAGPVRVEEFATLAVGAFVGVCTEVVPLAPVLLGLPFNTARLTSPFLH